MTHTFRVMLQMMGVWWTTLINAATETAAEAKTRSIIASAVNASYGASAVIRIEHMSRCARCSMHRRRVGR